MKDILFYYSPCLTGNYHKIDEKGIIYKYNMENMGWIDISSNVCHPEPYWILIDEDELYETILKDYENNFLNVIEYMKLQPNRPQVFDDYVMGSSYTYYTNGEIVACQDENFNEYVCEKMYLQLINAQFISADWIKLERNQVIKMMNHTLMNIEIKDMELYLDSNNDIIAIDDECNNYRLSTTTGDVSIVDNKGGVNKNWKSIDKSYLDTLDIEYEGILYDKDINARIEMKKYLQKNKTKLSKDKGIKLDTDLFYYVDSFTNVYAEDKNHNQYTITPKDILPLEEKKDLSKYERISPLEVLTLAKLRQDRIKTLKEKDPTYTVFDLDLFRNKDERVFGYTEEGQTYILADDGEFINLKEVDEYFTSFDCTKNPISNIEVLSEQHFNSANSVLEMFIQEGTEKVFDDYNIEVGDEFNWYHKKDSTKLYFIDNKEQEFKCSEETFIPIKKGSINKKDYEPITTDYFIAYLLINAAIHDEEME